MNQFPQTKSQTSGQSQNTATRASGRTQQKLQSKIEELEKTVAELKAEQSASVSDRPGSDLSNTNPDAGEVIEPEGDSIRQLRSEPMMAHLMDSLAAGKDIGHYGRLVFAMVAHHFLPRETVLEWLTRDPDFGGDEATALLRQVESRDYSPPRRERILAWQAQQDFPILPDPDDPDCGNVYRNLKFPDKVYEHIQEYQEEKAEAASE